MTTASSISREPNARGGEKTPDLSLADLAREVSIDPEDAECVLREMQEWDPVGVCARSLQECLRVQAEVFGCDDLELQIIDRHLHNLEKHNYAAIARDLKTPIEEVYEAIKQIQKLESRPARNFSETDDKSIAITPDVYVLKDGDRFVVSDNDRGVQRLYINESLTKQLLRDPQAKEFIGEKLRNAQWLIRAIEQRRKTIIRVTECIVEKQREFFEKGVAFLKPMILRDVAEAVGMHESTISRVTTNKYVHTTQGLFELKYFFNSSIRRGLGRRHRERKRQAGYQEDHRRGGQGDSDVRPANRRTPFSSRRHPNCAAYGCQISRDAGNSVLEQASQGLLARPAR